MNIPYVPKPDVPALTDKVIVKMQDVLKENLWWLDYSFGRSQKLVTTKEGKNYFYPAVHIGKGTYINVLPDQELGNYSFFTIEDPQEIDFNARAFNNIKSKFALVFWFNLDNVFRGADDRNTEAIKAQIIELLTRGIHLSEGRINIRQIFEQPENIYKGYSLKEVDSQYMMQPFAGLRFEGEMLFMEGGC